MCSKQPPTSRVKQPTRLPVLDPTIHNLLWVQRKQLARIAKGRTLTEAHPRRRKATCPWHQCELLVAEICGSLWAMVRGVRCSTPRMSRPGIRGVFWLLDIGAVNVLWRLMSGRHRTIPKNQGWLGQLRIIAIWLWDSLRVLLKT